MKASSWLVPVLAVALSGAAPAAAKDIELGFEAQVTAAFAAVRETRERSGYGLKHHKDPGGLIQQLNGVMAHLVEETKPSVVRIRLEKGSGSGFIVGEGGIIVTNAHVAQAAGQGGSVQVDLNGAEPVRGVVVSLAEDKDLAVVRLVSPRSDWPALRLGDFSKLREGHFVVAMGSPFGLPFSVSLGIASGLERDALGDGVKVSYVQTDAAVNPGNSGGPLLAMDGTVVGVNRLILSPSQASAGVAFSISIDSVKDYLKEYFSAQHDKDPDWAKKFPPPAVEQEKTVAGEAPARG